MILELVEEGRRVREGDLLVSFDTSGLEDEKVTVEIKVRNDESDLVQAQEELAVKLNQAEADVSAAELDARFAVEDHKKYLEGDFPKDLKEAENKITIAQEELRRSTETREGSSRLYEQGFISLTELEADRLSERKNQLTLEVSQQAYDLLAGWTHRRKIDEFESDIVQKEMALERARRKAKADIAQAEARVAARGGGAAARAVAARPHQRADRQGQALRADGRHGRLRHPAAAAGGAAMMSRWRPARASASGRSSSRCRPTRTASPRSASTRATSTRSARA